MSDIDTQQNVSDAHVVAPGSVPAEPPASTPGPGDTPAGEQAGEGEGTKPQPTRDRRAEKRISRLTRDYTEAQREIGRLQGMLEAGRSGERPATPDNASAAPQQSQFRTYEEYVDARAEWKAEQAVEKRMRDYQTRTSRDTVEQSEQERRKAFRDQAFTQGKDIDGFQEAYETVTSEDFPMTRAIGEYLLDAAEQKAGLVKWLADNEDEAARISRLSVAAAAKELAKVEARISAKPTPRSTSAPPPIPPVGGRAAPQAEPRKMSMDEYAEWRRTRNP